MARLTGALFSLAASGTIADTLTFASWKGIQYVRTRVIPANPRSVAQQDVRGIFSTLNEMWKRMPVGARRPFQYAARGQAFTDRNKHIGENVAVLQGEADLDNLVMSVASGGAVPPASIASVDGGGQTIDVTLVAPTIPTGYTLEWMEAAAVLDGDPSPVLVRTTTFNDDDVAPYVINLDVGVAGTYQVAGWCHMAITGTYYISEALRETVVVA